MFQTNTCLDFTWTHDMNVTNQVQTWGKSTVLKVETAGMLSFCVFVRVCCNVFSCGCVNMYDYVCICACLYVFMCAPVFRQYVFIPICAGLVQSFVNVPRNWKSPDLGSVSVVISLTWSTASWTFAWSGIREQTTPNNQKKNRKTEERHPRTLSQWITHTANTCQTHSC